MSIITLTTDLGHRDYYVAAVKAAILSHAPNTQVVDITHHIAPFSIYEAAYQLRSVCMDFPIGTVHILGINPELKADQPHIVVHHMSHYFIGADNGIFSLLFDTEPEDIFEITLPQGESWTFPLKGVFATTAAHLANGGTPELLGRRVKSVKKTQANTPLIDEDLLRGSVIQIDHYGNVVINITRTLFDNMRRGRQFSISFKRAGYSITKISEYFTEVIEGERLAMFATNGYLIIAINGGVTGHGGSAASLFGLRLNDIIRVEFYGSNDKNRKDDL
ncbi:MAG: SAM-dependent chlorinase/fluorinase [Flavobacteriales bacterium]|nr:SAM-dependent chlorinase/fluorinase [Flavobacteriales bacterium]